LPVVTITDVASRVGVSVATISRFLSGENVREEKKIRSVIQELNYRPNIAARNLKLGRSATVAIIVPDISNPFFAAIVRGAEKASGDSLMAAIVNTDSNSEREISAFVHLYGRVDGAIFVPTKESDHKSGLSHFGRPIVFVDRYLQNEKKYDTVLADNARGAQLAVEHFASQGHAKIAIIAGPLDSTPGRQREEGFRKALDNSKIRINPNYVVVSDFTQSGGYAAMNQLLDLAEPPTAVFSSNNLMTYGALTALKDRGVSVPSDISLIGFDDFELSTLISPKITVINRDAEAQGAQAMRALMWRLENMDSKVSKHSVIPINLIKRESVTIPRTWDLQNSHKVKDRQSQTSDHSNNKEKVNE